MKLKIRPAIWLRTNVTFKLRCQFKCNEKMTAYYGNIALIKLSADSTQCRWAGMRYAYPYLILQVNTFFVAIQTSGIIS